jgi:DNA (cytosine-5)-methyltransferase 1
MYLDAPRGRKILSAYINRLRRAGYMVGRFDLNSADFGLPQTRRRIVVVAVQESRIVELPNVEPLNAQRWLTIGEALAGLPTKPESQLPNHIASRESSINVARMSYADMGRGRTAIPEKLQLNCHRGYDGHLDVFGRLDWFGFARTITGGFDSSSRGEYTHPFLNRSITAREAARIQGFPDEFDFQGNRADVRRQIGNAVPPPLGFAIGKALKKVLSR